MSHLRFYWRQAFILGLLPGSSIAEDFCDHSSAGSFFLSLHYFLWMLCWVYFLCLNQTFFLNRIHLARRRLEVWTQAIFVVHFQLGNVHICATNSTLEVASFSLFEQFWFFLITFATKRLVKVIGSPVEFVDFHFHVLGQVAWFLFGQDLWNCPALSEHIMIAWAFWCSRRLLM